MKLFLYNIRLMVPLYSTTITVEDGVVVDATPSHLKSWALGETIEDMDTWAISSEMQWREG